MLFSGTFSEEVAPWRKGEKRECRFVFIGKDLDHKALEQGFLDCKAEDLRFNVGDRVYANVGEFAEGKDFEMLGSRQPIQSRNPERRKNPMFGCQSIMTITSDHLHNQPRFGKGISCLQSCSSVPGVVVGELKKAIVKFQLIC